MSDRRIRPEEAREDRLKHLAGLLEKLTYSEMHRLSALLQNHEAHDGYPDQLLAVSAELLGRDRDVFNL